MIYVLLILQIITSIFGLIKRDDIYFKYSIALYFMYIVALFLGILVLKTMEYEGEGTMYCTKRNTSFHIHEDSI